MKFAICFCVHSGELEIKALLLVASLRKHWPAEVELIGCIPEQSAFGELSDDSRGAFQALDVRLVGIQNPIGADYPIANKLLCLDVATEADRIIFLDSDITALAGVTEQDLATVFGEGFVAKPADLATFKADHAQWQSIYRSCGAEVPDVIFTATTSGETMAPYFNAGVVAVDANSGFGNIWTECAQKIDQLPNVPAKRPHLDQIALPVAATKSGLPFNLVDEGWNFPAHLKPLPAALPHLCHYHWPEVISREPALLDSFEELRAQVPKITKLAEHEPKWPFVVNKTRSKRTYKRPSNLPIGLITGIPRSGTSYLCSLLHDLKDHVVINEPAEIFAPLKMEAPGHRLACYYRDLRRRVLDGEEVENKTDGGKIIADTAKLDRRTAAPMSVEREDFKLWTKNTLAYLNRLPQLLEAMPEATFIACVRHPVDTIASWARTFPHLRDADVEKFPIGYPTDPFLSSEQRDKLAEIAECHDPPRRRAMLWNYLAGIILQHRDRLILIRLEDLAADRRSAVEFIATAAERSIDCIRSRLISKPVQDASLAECSDRAEALGYSLVRKMGSQQNRSRSPMRIEE
jgi:hypothetical protein